MAKSNKLLKKSDEHSEQILNEIWEEEMKEEKEIEKIKYEIGYKGYIQLAQRSGQYLDIAVTDVRVGELMNYDSLEKLKFNWIQDEDEREKLPIIGYVAYFKLINGATKYLYMTKEQMENHFMKYSKTYAKNKSFYIAIFDEMAQRIIINILLRKYLIN
ncbi:recombinase RecT [Spiroplasma phoeniceum]|uniref:recombinase RecT n=1 Tax=Spiroplasma phoeniceum TaxID=47835 RepID=UPI000DF78DD4|nr:recombinase RecT [Spiroplasma phoeniceum]